MFTLPYVRASGVVHPCMRRLATVTASCDAIRFSGKRTVGSCFVLDTEIDFHVVGPVFTARRAVFGSTGGRSMRCRHGGMPPHLTLAVSGSCESTSYNPPYQQRDMPWCGKAYLRTLIASYGGNNSPYDVRQWVAPGQFRACELTGTRECSTTSGT